VDDVVSFENAEIASVSYRQAIAFVTISAEEAMSIKRRDG
jgi:hypothetical protein